MIFNNLFSTLALNWDWIFQQGTWELESTIINTVAVISMHVTTGIRLCKQILKGENLILECKELGILIRDLILPLFQEWRRGKVIRSSDSQRSAFKIDEANLWHLKCAKVSSRLKGAHVHMFRLFIEIRIFCATLEVKSLLFHHSQLRNRHSGRSWC